MVPNTRANYGPRNAYTNQQAGTTDTSKVGMTHTSRVDQIHIETDRRWGRGDFRRGCLFSCK